MGFPAWRYRVVNNEIEKRVFHSEEEIPNGEGWGGVPHRNDDGSLFIEAEADAVVLAPEPEPEPEIDFDNMTKADLIELADKLGVQIDRRWGRSRIEEALRSA